MRTGGITIYRQPLRKEHIIKKIKFIYAGGTIGMKPDSSGTLVKPGSDAEFQAACKAALGDWPARNGLEVVYDFFTAKDSTNMTPDDWQAMLYRIHEAQDQGYSAVCMAHGTDTLAYSASALAFGMHGADAARSALNIPVVLSGGQNSIYEFGGDGQFNVQNLFRTAKAALEPEVPVADVLINFGYDVLLGCRALKVSEKDFKAFESPSEFGRVGHINSYGVNLYLHRLRKWRSDADRLGDIKPKFSKGVVVFDVGPGTEPGHLESLVKGGGVLAMILKTPGEGNIPTEGTYNLLPFISSAVHKMKVPILIASKFLGGAVGKGDYELGRAALEAGAVACYDTTDVGVEVKVRWLLGNGIVQSVEDVRQAMAHSYVGEVTEPVSQPTNGGLAAK